MSKGQTGGNGMQPDITTRPGRMRAGGRLSATVKSLKTGDHITVNIKCMTPPQSGRGWKKASWSDGVCAFISVTNVFRRDYNDKVGHINLRQGKFVEAKGADPTHVWAAKQVLAYAFGMETNVNCEIHEEERCGCCGRALTDPESIERGIGPECYGKQTGSKPAYKSKKKTVEPAIDAGSEP